MGRGRVRMLCLAASGQAAAGDVIGK